MRCGRPSPGGRLRFRRCVLAGRGAHDPVAPNRSILRRVKRCAFVFALVAAVTRAAAAQPASEPVAACTPEQLDAVFLPEAPGLYVIVDSPGTGPHVEPRAPDRLAGALCFVQLRLDGPQAHVVALGTDYLERIPLRERTADAALATTPGAEDAGFGGTQVAETRWYLDGFDLGAPRLGVAAPPVPLDFLAGVSARSGATRAEHPIGTGGLVSLTTARGSDAWHGSVSLRWTPGLFVSGATGERTTDDAIAAERSLGSERELGAEIGGPIVPGVAWFRVGAAPRWRDTELDRVVRARADADGDGRADRRDDGSLRLEEVERAPLTEGASSLPLFARLDARAAPGHDVHITALRVSSDHDERGVLGPSSAMRRTRARTVAAVVAGWTSRIAAATRIDATVGWYADRDQVGGDLDTPQWSLAAGELADVAVLGGESAAVRDACDDGAPGGFARCPIPGYAIGGVGEWLDLDQRRLGGRVGARHDVRALGRHTLAAGLDASAERLVSERAFSGGELGRLRGDALELTRLVELGTGDEPCGLDDRGQPIGCTATAALATTSTTQTLAAYAQDTWYPVPAVALDVGLRYGTQRLRWSDELRARGEAPSDGDAVTLDGLWAPRLGVSYDWSGEGRSRLYLAWTRAHAPLPLAFNETALAAVARQQLACNVADDATPGAPGASCEPSVEQSSVSVSGPRAIDPALEAPYEDDLVAGIEVEPMPWARLGLDYQRRTLSHPIEDAQVEGALLVTNPDGARRRYDALHLTLVGHLHRQFYVRAAYTYARTTGSYAGPVDAARDDRALVTERFDAPAGTVNDDGVLPQDHRHSLEVDGYFVAPLGGGEEVLLGVTTRTRSGTPTSHLAPGPAGGLVFVLPRASGERTETVTETDLHLGFRRYVAAGTVVELFLEVFNVVNAQKQLALDERYADDAVDPIDGGTTADLVYLRRADDAGLARPNPRFGKPTAYADPRAIRFGLRLSF